MLPLHLLAVLLQDNEGIVVPVLTKLGVNASTLQSQVMERIAGCQGIRRVCAASSFRIDGQNSGPAFKEADSFKDEYVSTEHLLLAMTADKDKANESRQLLTLPVQSMTQF